MQSLDAGRQQLRTLGSFRLRFNMFSGSFALPAGMQGRDTALQRRDLLLDLLVETRQFANQLIQATQFDLDLLTAHGIPVLDVGSRRIHGAAFAHTGPTSPDLQFATFAAWGWTDGGASCA